MAIISTVFCANGPLRKLSKMAEEKYPAKENFDGIIAFDQQFGCSQTGQDLVTTCKIIAGIAKNANFGGVLLVSNDCEMAIPTVLEDYLGQYDKHRIKTLTLQTVEDEFEEGMKLIDAIMEEVQKDHRTPINLSRLHIALNCGGSDGYSGITANTLLGTLCDRMVQKGAIMNMTEVPEMMGAEHILMNRAVMEVLKYGDRATKNGFILISGPGHPEEKLDRLRCRPSADCENAGRSGSTEPGAV